jgi:hypothetical protein
MELSGEGGEEERGHAPAAAGCEVGSTGKLFFSLIFEKVSH